MGKIYINAKLSVYLNLLLLIVYSYLLNSAVSVKDVIGSVLDVVIVLLASYEILKESSDLK